jgi:hypothetical protein
LSHLIHFVDFHKCCLSMFLANFLQLFLQILNRHLEYSKYKIIGLHVKFMISKIK